MKITAEAQRTGSLLEIEENLRILNELCVSAVSCPRWLQRFQDHRQANVRSESV